MSRSKNTIKNSDASSTPIKVKYSATYASQSLYSNGITTNRGIYYSAPKVRTNAYTLRNNYAVMRQLYYQNYLTGSVIGSASYWDSSLQSTAASGTFDDDNRYFPSATGSNIAFIAIPRSQFGEQISRHTFKLVSTDNTTYNIIDDGNGNIVDTFNNNLHVGNILYAQGIVTITHPDYIAISLNTSFGAVISVAVAPSPTPTPTVSSTPGASKSPTPSITKTPSLTPTVTPSLTKTPSLTPTKTASKTPTPTKTPSKTVTPSITPSKTITPTPTPSITITPSASPAVIPQAYISVYGYNDASGYIIANADNSGDVIDTITITGTISKYSGAGCSGLLGGCGFSGINSLVIAAGTPNASHNETGRLCLDGTFPNWKATSLVVNGTTITSNNQQVTINGNVYVITGYNVCTAL
jgi:hypothetical protein